MKGHFNIVIYRRLPGTTKHLSAHQQGIGLCELLLPNYGIRLVRGCGKHIVDVLDSVPNWLLIKQDLYESSVINIT